MLLPPSQISSWNRVCTCDKLGGSAAAFQSLIFSAARRSNSSSSKPSFADGALSLLPRTEGEHIIHRGIVAIGHRCLADVGGVAYWPLMPPQTARAMNVMDDG